MFGISQSNPCLAVAHEHPYPGLPPFPIPEQWDHHAAVLLVRDGEQLARGVPAAYGVARDDAAASRAALRIGEQRSGARAAIAARVALQKVSLPPPFANSMAAVTPRPEVAEPSTGTVMCRKGPSWPNRAPAVRKPCERHVSLDS